MPHLQFQETTSTTPTMVVWVSNLLVLEPALVEMKRHLPTRHFQSCCPISGLVDLQLPSLSVAAHYLIRPIVLRLLLPATSPLLYSHPAATHRQLPERPTDIWKDRTSPF